MPLDAADNGNASRNPDAVHNGHKPHVMDAERFHDSSERILGAISKVTEDAGITKDQLERIRTEVTPGTSALFLVTEAGDLDRVGERFKAGHSKLIDTNLTGAERQVLLETFGGH